MSVEQCSRCLREAGPPVYVHSMCYCVACAAEIIAVAVQRLAAAVRKMKREEGEA